MRRLAFLVGLVALFSGFFLLIDPMAVEERNCGSALLRKKVHQVGDERIHRRCGAKLDRRVLPGWAIFGGGILMVVTNPPRVMLEAD